MMKVKQEKFKMSEEAFYHYALMDLNSIVEDQDIHQILHDFKKYYPTSFKVLQNAFIHYEPSLPEVQE